MFSFRNLMRMLWLLVVTMFVGVAAAAGSGELSLTRDGRPAATIVLGVESTDSARFAAAELQYHVKKITGATLPIVTEGDPVAGTRILVGDSAAAKALGLCGVDFQREEYVIKFLPDALALLGHDSGLADGVQVSPARAPGKFGRAGSFDGKQTVVAVNNCGFRDEVGTLEAWIWMPATVSATAGTIMRLDSGEPWTYHIVQRDPQSSVISYTIYDGSRGVAVRSVPLAEGWHHVAATHDLKANTMELFIDGQSAGKGDCLKTTCERMTLGIGGVPNRDHNPVGNPFLGLIDEVRVSKAVRNPAADIAKGPFDADADATCLCHFDEPNGAPLDAIDPAENTATPALFASNGTLWAVYDFLERYCGVRWYAPGEVGLVCPHVPSLAVPATDRRHQIAMEMRWIAGGCLYLSSPKDAVPWPDEVRWKLRMRLGGLRRITSHSFYGYYDRHLKDHPDWFAQGYSDPKPPQMCYTSAGFAHQAAQDANDYFSSHASNQGDAVGDNLFGLVPMDNSFWCKCASCQALLNPAEKDNPQFNNGQASDYIFDFTNRVAREVGKTHPDQWIGQLAYSTYAYHPENVKLEPNIMVQMCLHTRNWWCPSMEANDHKMLADWRRLEPDRPLNLWLYYCFPALNAKYEGFHYFPGFFAHQVVRQMKLYHDAKIRGMFIENSSEFGATYFMDQLEYYVTFKLADDPTLDGNELIEEFFVKYYGPATAPMKSLYCRIEDLYTNPKYYPEEIQKSNAHRHQTEELAWGSLGTPERMAEMQTMMDQAVAAAQAEPEKERVRLFKIAIWDYMVEGRRLYEEKKK